MNKSLSISFQKLDQLIGMPPPLIYTKHSLYGGKPPYHSQNSLIINKKRLLKSSQSQFRLTPNSSFTGAVVHPKISKNEALSYSEKRAIFLAKCEDLKITPIPVMEKRFFNYIGKMIINRTLVLNDNHLNTASARALGKILKSNSSFYQLELSKNNLGDKGLKILIESLKFNRSIIHIDLSSNKIYSEGASAFFKMILYNESIVSIDLGSRGGINKNQIGVAGIAPLREVLIYNKFLMFLVLPDCQIGPEGLEYISEGLANNTILEHLNLANNGLTGKSMKNFFYSLKFSSISELILSKNNIGDDGAEVIGNFFLLYSGVTKIRSLSLSDSQIEHKGGNLLFLGILQVRSLSYFNVKYNNFTEATAGSLQVLLEENISMGYFNLMACQLREFGVEKLSEGLCNNRTLKTLNLSDNMMKDLGVSYLTVPLQKNRVLLDLDLSKNQITSEGAITLFSALMGNDTLNILILADNLIKDNSADFIIDYLRVKKNLQVIRLEENPMTARFLSIIQDYIKKNTKYSQNINSKKLKTEVRRLSRKDFSTKKIEKQISMREQEHKTLSVIVETQKKNIEEIKEELQKELDVILEEYSRVNKKYLDLSNQLSGLEFEQVLEKNKGENKIQRMLREIRKVEVEIDQCESNCNKNLDSGLVGANRKLKNTLVAEFRFLEEEKALVDRKYKFAYSNFKILSKKVKDMIIERDKIKKVIC